TESVIWVGARHEALRQLAEWPKEGRDVYALTANPRAKQLLDEARQRRDWQRLEALAHRYPLTPAGNEALKLLGLHHLDRGNVLEAARWLEMWTQREPAWRQDGPAAFAVWLAMRRSGLLAEADRVWDALQAQHGTGLNLGNRKVALGELRTQF